ncbi:MAG: hypothetical protein GY833_23975 [Aestuariibacter sp.]|nr:hypothetical protein [Aestuariibacter sp.]
MINQWAAQGKTRAACFKGVKMKIAILVGKTEKGKFETIGDVGSMDKCKKRLSKITANNGVDGKTQYVKLILGDMNREPLKIRKFSAVPKAVKQKKD